MLYIDSREPMEIMSLMEMEGLSTEMVTLDIGDFLEKEKGIVIERKTVEDFIGSVISGHLQKQLLQMEQFPHQYLVITGNHQDSGMVGGFSSRQFCGAIASCCARFTNLKVVRMANSEEMVLFIKSLISKIGDGKVVDIHQTELLKETVVDGDYKKAILMLFPKIGIKKAEKFLLDMEIHSELEKFLSFLKEKKVFK